MSNYECSICGNQFHSYKNKEKHEKTCGLKSLDRNVDGVEDLKELQDEVKGAEFEPGESKQKGFGDLEFIE